MDNAKIELDQIAESSRAASPGGIHISITALSKSFGNVEVLRDVDLEIAPGEFVAIVGRSGCGKSTLLRQLAGLDGPSAGRIAFDGKPAAGLNDDVRIMFQDARLLPWRSVLRNVGLGVPGNWRAAAAQALKQVGLGHRGDDWPAVLSGGQRQRVALARALVHKPRLLLLDEPLGALDALTRIEMQRLIESLWQAQGFTAVLVTHDVQEAVALADRVILIESGRITLDERIDLPRPRERGTAAFAGLEGRVLDRVLGIENLDARNRVRGHIGSIASDGVVSEVTILTGQGAVTAVVTDRSLAEAGLAEGAEVEALFKGSSVALARTVEGVPSYFHHQPGKS
jgi:sulfonate transport system ATP-binding protein